MKKKKKTDNHSILTRETLGVTTMMFSALVFIMLLSFDVIFMSVGSAICTFMYGTFGYASYLVIVATAYLGEWLTFEKRIKIKSRYVSCAAGVLVCLFLLFHSVTTAGYDMSSYGTYLSSCYTNAANGYSGYTFGGVVAGLIVYPVAKLTTFIGAYVIFSVFTAIFAVLTFLVARNVYLGKVIKQSVKSSSGEEAEYPNNESVSKAAVSDRLYSENDNHEIVSPATDGAASYSGVENISYRNAAMNASPSTVTAAEETSAEDEDRFSRKNLGRKILFENGEFAAESYRRNMIYSENSYFNHPVHNDDDYIKGFRNDAVAANTSPASDVGGSSYTEDYSDKVQYGGNTSSAPSYVYGDKPVSDLTDKSKNVGGYTSYTVEPQKSSDISESGLYDYKDEEEEVNIEDFPAQSSSRSEYPASSSIGNEYTTSSQQPVSRSDYVAPEEDIPHSVEEESGAHGNAFGGRETYDSRESLFGEADLQPEEFQSQDAYSDDKNVTQSDVAENSGSSDEVSAPDDRTRSFMNLFSSSNRRLDESGNRTEVPPLKRDANSLGRESATADRVVGFTDSGNVEKSSADTLSCERDGGRENIFDDDDGGNLFSDEKPLVERTVPQRNTVENSPVGSASGVRVAPASRSEVPPADVKSKAPEPEKPKPVEEKPKHVWKKYVRPTMDLLDDYPENNNVNTGEIEENKQAICETLANFRIESRVAEVVVGPAITRYDVIIEDRTNIKNALKYRDAIAMALMKENVNAYLNYAKGAVSYEIPNAKRTTVGLKTMLASSEFLNAKPNSLTFTLGKTVDGQIVCPDITKMPHLLVAGTTGSGKSICLSTLICSLLYKYGPEELRFILVDPKQVEFISYDKLPHLMINEIIYDVDKAMKALNWAIKEMERRYSLFKEMTENGIATKNLTEYNAHLPEGEEKLPKIVIILDEFGDLMLQAKKEIESRIIRLVQKARACGIHLILATQRPSVDCITGLIKSNLPTRIGFKVNSFDDSRCIFDIGGAEKLLGKGDLYFRSAESPDLARVQGCFIDTHEVQKVTDFVKANNETYFDESVSEFINKSDDDVDDSSSSDGDSIGESTKVDDTFIKALWFCVTSNQASVSMIQRRFPIGYMKACKIIDWMENMNYITHSEGSKPRKVLLSRDEFIQKYGEIDD